MGCENKTDNGSKENDNNKNNQIEVIKEKIRNEVKNEIESNKIENQNAELNLLKILHLVQEEYGYVPLEIAKFISDEVHLPLSKIFSVVTFYNEFKTEKRGKYVIRCCLGTACKIKGGSTLLEYISKKLNLKAGQTSKDGLFTLETVNCFGACSMAPVIEINGKIHGHMDEKLIDEFLDHVKKNE